MTDEKSYYIVNPKGAIHIVSREHAQWRLQSPGWRLATPEEIQKYNDAGGNQSWDKPLAAPWNPNVFEQDVPVVKRNDRK